MSLTINGQINRGVCSFQLNEEIAPGEVVAVVGPNGAGKTTLLNVVAGLLRMKEGVLSLNGRTLDHAAEDVFVAPENRNIGMMFQSLHLVPMLTAAENVALALRAHGANKKDAHSVALQKLVIVDASHLANRPASQLSGGEAQRVALARAIASQPSVLLLDEPLSAIDASSKEPLRAVLTSVLTDFSGVTLLVSHDPADVATLATRTIALGG